MKYYNIKLNRNVDLDYLLANFVKEEENIYRLYSPDNNEYIEVNSNTFEVKMKGSWMNYILFQWINAGYISCYSCMSYKEQNILKFPCTIGNIRFQDKNDLEKYIKDKEDI